jgi:RimJ/RimL family protein N-acetyltransferase
VRLEPLTPAHAPALFAALAFDSEIFRWRPVEPPETLAGMDALIEASLAAQARGAVVVFAQVEAATGRAVGGTSYSTIDRPNRMVEIGATWLGRPWQRTAINTEAKYLLLEHAFEVLGAVRVQFRTDLRNRQSQAAIERLGAVREGVLRKHTLVKGGVYRDTVMYGIVDDEWLTVKARLRAKMAAYEN